MRRIVCAFTVAMLICAATYETCHAAPIEPLTGIQPAPGNTTLVYSHHYRPYIVVPLMRHYGYLLTGGLQASTIGLPLGWNAGGIGVKEPVLSD
jgi:hypothetical protein